MSFNVEHLRETSKLSLANLSKIQLKSLLNLKTRQSVLTRYPEELKPYFAVPAASVLEQMQKYNQESFMQATPINIMDKLVQKGKSIEVPQPGLFKVGVSDPKPMALGMPIYKTGDEYLAGEGIKVERGSDTQLAYAAKTIAMWFTNVGGSWELKMKPSEAVKRLPYMEYYKEADRAQALIDIAAFRINDAVNGLDLADKLYHLGLADTVFANGMKMIVSHFIPDLGHGNLRNARDDELIEGIEDNSYQLMKTFYKYRDIVPDEISAVPLVAAQRMSTDMKQHLGGGTFKKLNSGHVDGIALMAPRDKHKRIYDDLSNIDLSGKLTKDLEVQVECTDIYKSFYTQQALSLEGRKNVYYSGLSPGALDGKCDTEQEYVAESLLVTHHKVSIPSKGKTTDTSEKTYNEAMVKNVVNFVKKRSGPRFILVKIPYVNDKTLHFIVPSDYTEPKYWCIIDRYEIEGYVDDSGLSVRSLIEPDMLLTEKTAVKGMILGWHVLACYPFTGMTMKMIREEWYKRGHPVDGAITKGMLPMISEGVAKYVKLKAGELLDSKTGDVGDFEKYSVKKKAAKKYVDKSLETTRAPRIEDIEKPGASTSRSSASRSDSGSHSHSHGHKKKSSSSSSKGSKGSSPKEKKSSKHGKSRETKKRDKSNPFMAYAKNLGTEV